MVALSYMAQVGRRLLENGYSPIPIGPHTKRPSKQDRGQWTGYTDWTRFCDAPAKAFVLGIWEKWPGCGVGIACGRVFAVDIDITDETLSRQMGSLAVEHFGYSEAIRIGNAPKRLIVYRCTQDVRSRNIGPVQILGHGRQFVAYAIHPDTGRPYEWIDGSLVDMPVHFLPEVTPAQIDAFCAAVAPLVGADSAQPGAARPQGGDATSWRGQAGTLEAVAAAVQAIPNDDLPYDDWVAVGLAIKAALPEGPDAARQMFCEWSAKAPKNKPIETAKKWRTIGQPREIGAGSLYYRAMEAGWVPPADLVLCPDDLPTRIETHPAQALIDKLNAPPPAPPSVAPASPDFWDVPGGLGLFVDWCVETAPRAQPFLALAAGISMFGALAGRRYKVGKVRSNVYTVGIADSGAGKDHPRRCALDALYAAGLSQYAGGDDLASGAALHSTLARHPAVLFRTDEFGHMLAGWTDKRAPGHKREIWAKLTQLYSSAGSVFGGIEYADQKTRPRQDIVQPCACLLASTVPGPFWKALENGAMTDGSLARFLIFVSPENYPALHRRAPDIEPPDGLIEVMQAVAAGVAGHDYGGDLAYQMSPTSRPSPYDVPIATEAEPILDALYADQDEWLRQAEGTNRTATIARYSENAVKLALIRAVASKPQDPVIDAACMRWARDLTQHCIETMAKNADIYMADTEVEARHKKVLEIIRGAGADGITQTDLTRRTMALNKRDRGDVLMGLIEAGYIERVQLSQPGKGRNAIAFRAIPSILSDKVQD